jgi:hypothetical protein
VQVVATAGNGSAAISWQPPASDGGSPITRYTVTPFLGSAAQTPVTVTGSPPVTTATVTGLINGFTYTFIVSATNAIGTGPASSPSNPVTPIPPASPNNAGATAINLGTINCGQAVQASGDNTTGTHAWYTFTFNQSLCTLHVDLSGSLLADSFSVHPGAFDATPIATGVTTFSTLSGGVYFIDVSGGTTGTQFSLQIAAH